MLLLAMTVSDICHLQFTAIALAFCFGNYIECNTVMIANYVDAE